MTNPDRDFFIANSTRTNNETTYSIIIFHFERKREQIESSINWWNGKKKLEIKCLTI